MNALERAAAARILIDLIKADKVIDCREMELYSRAKTRYGISREDEIKAYSMTLERAVEVMRLTDRATLEELMRLFAEMTMSDGFCAREEALLMTMLTLCLEGDEPCGDVISTVIEEAWFDERQVLYVESRHAKDINFSITTDYRAIVNELKMCGLEFVYLPHILHHYITTNKSKLQEVMAMLSPSLTEDAINGLLMKIKLFKTDTFCIEQLHHKLGFVKLADTPPALMLRVSQSRVDDRIVTNFLRIEVAAPVLPVVSRFTDLFLSFNGSDRIVVSHKRDEAGSFLYSGFYRQVFEILLLQKSVECHMLIDFIHGRLIFPELDIVVSDIHRKEKALYTLFVYEAFHGAIRDEEGKVKSNGTIKFSLLEAGNCIESYDRRMDLLKRKYAKVYAAFGGEEEKVPDIINPDIRRPMLAVLNREIKRHNEKIYDVGRYVISNPQRRGLYGITAIPETFQCVDFSHPDPVSILDSDLFATLDLIN